MHFENKFSLLFLPAMPSNSIQKLLGADFESSGAARSVIRQYIVEQGESYRITHSNANLHVVTCRDLIKLIGSKRKADIRSPCSQYGQSGHNRRSFRNAARS
jgi:hypothetical protein